MIFNSQLWLETQLELNIFSDDLLTLLILKDKNYSANKSRVDSLNRLFTAGLVEIVKGSKKEEPYMKARLSKKAKDLFRDLELPGVTEEVKEVFYELSEAYKEHGREALIKNKRKSVSLLAWFMMETEFDRDTIINTVNNYLSQTEIMYTSSLENLIWKAPNLFATRPTTADSKLFTLIQNQ